MTDAQKKRFKSYSFWVSLASAILLLVQTVGRPLGLIIDEATYMSIVNSVLGVFVVLGIISHPAQNLIKTEPSGTEVESKEENKATKEEISDQSSAKSAVKVADATQNQAIIDESIITGGGITVDSKSSYDVGQDNTNVTENCNLSAKGQARLNNFKQELNNLQKM